MAWPGTPTGSANGQHYHRKAQKGSEMNTALHPIWNPGWLIWMFVGISFAGLGILSVAAGILRSFLTGKGSEKGFGLALTGIILFVIGGIVTGVTSIPWSGQYHRYIPVTGKVTA